MHQTAQRRSMISSTSPRPASAPARRQALRIVCLATMAAVLATAAGGTSGRAADGPGIAPEQQLVTLSGVKDVHARPVFDSPSVVGLADQRPITLVRTSLPVLAEMTDADGRGWFRVRLPGRVFHRKTPPPTGWITASDTRTSYTAWHLVVDIRTRRVLVYHDGRLARAFDVIVGKPSTPTPRGEYFVEETMRLPAKNIEFPGALATSARSHVLKEFMGGPGQIALHGVANIGGQMGTAVSNGCIRMTTSAIVWLRERIGPGVPLTIR
ncbi:MAG: hypothetical protein QOJ35_3079 [Solirubrobacteraceae bacterium]|jgi:lipoprotein-anchoring transpeptidase ErfK/SrfK|nr:hypothetical protein [Solirubrobacteraceae bacterium]